MHIRSYAKINLGLRIVRRRPDGFHDIDTVFHRIGLFDDIELLPAPSLSVSCTDPAVPSGPGNLCWAAAEAVIRSLGAPNGASISITKRIPSGAGLGGGSSNAAAVLRHLPALLGGAVAPDELQRIALQLGSDVPFFLQERSAFGEGRGELLTPIDLVLPFWIVLVHPGIHVPTPWAYRALSEHRNGTHPVREPIRNWFTGTDRLGELGNDFEEVVFPAHPVIREVRDRLRTEGAVSAMMSGSGSSVFGLFATESAAVNAATIFRGRFFTHVTSPENQYR